MMVKMATATQHPIRVRRNAASSSLSKSWASFWISSAASRRASAIGSMPSPGLVWALNKLSYGERGSLACLELVVIPLPENHNCSSRTSPKPLGQYRANLSDRHDWTIISGWRTSPAPAGRVRRDDRRRRVQHGTRLGPAVRSTEAANYAPKLRRLLTSTCIAA